MLFFEGNRVMNQGTTNEKGDHQPSPDDHFAGSDLRRTVGELSLVSSTNAVELQSPTTSTSPGIRPSLEPINTIIPSDQNHPVSLPASEESGPSAASAYSSVLPPVASVRARLYFVSPCKIILSLFQRSVLSHSIVVFVVEFR